MLKKVFYRQSVMGNGFPVEVRMAKTGFFVGAEEIVRVASEECAQQLVFAITEAWASGATLFSVDDWLTRHSFAVWSPGASKYDLEMKKNLESLIMETEQCHQLLSEIKQHNEDIEKSFQKIKVFETKEA